MELACLPFVYKYTLSGYGVGLGVRVPGRPSPEGLRQLPLSDKLRLVVGIVHNGKPHALRDAFVAASREYTAMFRECAARAEAASEKKATPGKKKQAKRR